MRSRSSVALLVLAVVAVAVAALAATRDGGSQAAGSGSSPIQHVPEQDGRLRLVAHGDSITQGDSPSISTGDLGPRSWVKHIDNSSFRFVGGSARGGLTSARALDDIRSDFRGDIVVYALGTNDLRTAESTPAQFVRNILKHHRHSTGSRDATVVIVAVGPMRDRSAKEISAWNAAVKRGARAHGFHFIDPWTSIRTVDYTWRDPDDTFDGLHPTASGARKLGRAISRQLTDLESSQ